MARWTPYSGKFEHTMYINRAQDVHSTFSRKGMIDVGFSTSGTIGISGRIK